MHSHDLVDRIMCGDTVMSLTIIDVLRRNSTVVLPEHVLLQLIQANDSPASKVLSRLGLDVGRMRKLLEDHLGASITANDPFLSLDTDDPERQKLLQILSTNACRPVSDIAIEFESEIKRFRDLPPRLPLDSINFDRRTHQMLDRAEAEAAASNDNLIRSMHYLIAVGDDEESVMPHAMDEGGVNVSVIRSMAAVPH